MRRKTLIEALVKRRKTLIEVVVVHLMRKNQTREEAEMKNPDSANSFVLQGFIQVG